MSSIRSFEDLECWKAAREIRIFVAEQIIPKFPTEEKFALTSQLKRSSRSVDDNISEGYGRFHYQENIQFCRTARGSLCESFNQVITARDENYIEEDLLQQFRERFERTKAILNGYINYLVKTKME
jgi:four helix bundle protein